MPHVLRTIHALPQGILTNLHGGVVAITGDCGCGKTLLAWSLVERHLILHPQSQVVVLVSAMGPASSRFGLVAAWAKSHGWTTRLGSAPESQARLTVLTYGVPDEAVLVAKLHQQPLRSGDLVLVDNVQYAPLGREARDYLRTSGATLLVTALLWGDEAARWQPRRKLLDSSPLPADPTEIIRMRGNETPEQRDLVTTTTSADFLYRGDLFQAAAPMSLAPWIRRDCHIASHMSHQSQEISEQSGHIRSERDDDTD